MVTGIEKGMQRYHRLRNKKEVEGKGWLRPLTSELVANIARKAATPTPLQQHHSREPAFACSFPSKDEGTAPSSPR